MKWETFEEECCTFLNNKYGKYFQLKGKFDSNTSDILFNNGDNKFFIEVKMPNSQSGQFVLIPNILTSNFDYSDRNKAKENEYSKVIVKYMDENFNLFSQVGTRGKNIEIDNLIFYKWVENYYIGKGVEFIITKAEEFIIFPIKELKYYFDISAKYREKKSGSSKCTKSSIQDLEIALKNAKIEYQLNGTNIISMQNLSNLKIVGEKFSYILRGENNIYTARKLSNTKNANVIFSIKLKTDILKTKLETDLLNFEARIQKKSSL